MKKILIIFMLVLFCISICNYRKNSLSIILDGLNIENYAVNADYNCVCVYSSINKILDVLRIDNLTTINTRSGDIYEGYSNLLYQYRVVDGKKINIQISVKNDHIILGYPLISCSF